MTIDQGLLERYVRGALELEGVDVPAATVRRILDLELEYLQIKGVAAIDAQGPGSGALRVYCVDRGEFYVIARSAEAALSRARELWKRHEIDVTSAETAEPSSASEVPAHVPLVFDDVRFRSDEWARRGTFLDGSDHYGIFGPFPES